MKKTILAGLILSFTAAAPYAATQKRKVASEGHAVNMDDACGLAAEAAVIKFYTGNDDFMSIRRADESTDTKVVKDGAVYDVGFNWEPDCWGTARVNTKRADDGTCKALKVKRRGEIECT